MKKNLVRIAIAFGAALFCFAAPARADQDHPRKDLQVEVAGIIVPLMAQFDVPGMAVALTMQGRRQLLYFGDAVRESGTKVTEATLFEIGSISKTYTATLASYAQVRGALSFSDSVSQHLPDLAESAFRHVNLLDLGTYTAGGLPLQFPDWVDDANAMLEFYQGWKPLHPPGTHRRYSNPSVGLLGHVAAKSLDGSFSALMENMLFPALGLADTYLNVPAQRMADYAQGYAKDGRPIRVAPGVLDGEAYGIKTSAVDLLGFVEANLDPAALDKDLGRAIAGTQVARYLVGDMRQALGWEMYPYPVALDRLLGGNSVQMALSDAPVQKIDPLQEQPPMLINKTGSTNGFGAYVAFIPAKRLGVILLANRNYPVSERVTAGYRIITAMENALGGASSTGSSREHR